MTSSLTHSELDRLMDLGWPALERRIVQGWVVRLSAGVTSRANSVLPVEAPADLESALAAVEQVYGEGGLVPCFQISPGARPEGLDSVLAARGYEPDRPALVQAADLARCSALLAAPTGDVTIAAAPDEAWMDLWWSVDGRGGPDAYAVARRILTGGDALYACARDGSGVVAVARLALVGGWGGIYCLAVRPDARGRGHACSVLAALLMAGAREGVESLWLQVMETNLAARRLYDAAGFVTQFAYHYRTLPAPSR